MNSRISHAWRTVLATAALSLLAGSVSAVPTLTTRVFPIYQVGNGAGVNVGHVVIAGTNYNRLLASGAFSAHCASADMLPATMSRTLTTENILGGLSLYVTVPEWVPSRINMPGFYSLPRGTTVSCTYDWTSRAVEGGYSVGAGGVSFQTGNGERAEGSFQPFQMSVPGDTDTDDLQSCIP